MTSQLYINKPIKEDNILIDDEFIKLKKLIDNNDLESAKYKLIGIRNLTKNKNKYLPIISFYQNCIKEKSVQSDMIDNFTSVGLYYLNSGKNEDALSIFLEALDKTNYNLFNYYIAKALYKLKEYNKSLDYFNKYLLVGGTKEISTYVYMSKMLEKCTKHKNYLKAKVYLLKVKKIDKYEHSEKEKEELNNKIRRLSNKSKNNKFQGK